MFSYKAQFRPQISSNAPICAKMTFQIHEYPHELDKASGKYNMWWKENSFMLFYGENEGG